MVDDRPDRFEPLYRIKFDYDPKLAIQSPILQLGLSAWNKLRGARGMPAPEDIDPLRLPRQILPHVSLLEIERNPELRFRWRLLGTHITTWLNRDMTGRYWDDIYDARTLAKLARGPRWVIEHMAPLRCMGSNFRVDDTYLRSESLDMPLSSDGKVVDRLFIVTVFEEI